MWRKQSRSPPWPSLVVIQKLRSSDIRGRKREDVMRGCHDCKHGPLRLDKEFQCDRERLIQETGLYQTSKPISNGRAQRQAALGYAPNRPKNPFDSQSVARGRVDGDRWGARDGDPLVPADPSCKRREHHTEAWSSDRCAIVDRYGAIQSRERERERETTHFRCENRQK
jgi:hypothetical protein